MTESQQAAKDESGIASPEPPPPLFAPAEVKTMQRALTVKDFDELVAFAAEAAAEAYREVVQAAPKAAAEAFQAAMGDVDSVPHIRAFISSLAVALKDGFISATEAGKLMRIAERALERHGVGQ